MRRRSAPDRGAAEGGAAPVPDGRRSGRWVRRLVLAGLANLLVVVIAGAGALGYGWHLFTAPGPLASAATVVIPRGAGVDSIARLLDQNGVVAPAPVFRWAARLYARQSVLKAGEYQFPERISMRGALDLMASGRTVIRRFTVAEGLTTAEILQALADADGLVGKITSRPGEGDLMPDTYHYSLGDTRDSIIARMQSSMTDALNTLWAARSGDLPLNTAREALILASIVEKETGIAGERPLVASVFINRLRRGMRLQSDPTVVYAVTGGTGPLGRGLRRSELDRDHPYNTYTRAGLPPGPIANPGRDAIAAVLNPQASEFLFFVADGSGGHAFAQTLAEHNRNVARWRRIEREQLAQ